MIKLTEVSLLNILPPNLKADPILSAAALAIDNELQSLSADIKKINIYSRFNDWTDDEVDELAWEYRPPFYDADLPLEQKRLLIKNAIPYHRRKGTPSAIEDLITLLFGEGKVEEWWQYGGDPYHFRVVTNNSDITTVRAEEFVNAVDSVKRLSTVLDSVTITQAEDLSLYIGMIAHIEDYITI